MNNYLVVPSIRENCLKEFIHHWHYELKEAELLENLIIVEDNEQKTFDIDVKHHYSWNEIHQDLKDDAWIISKRDSAIRCYGFLVAHRLKADYIFTLDDDCYPETDHFFQNHINKLQNTTKWTELILGMRTRGIPYFNLGILDNVVANVGLWAGVPDYDSIQSLTTMKVDFSPPTNVDRVLPKNQFAPICGMNLAFKNNVAVLAYFPLMGQDSPFNRFDDIWFGIIFKKICDHLDLAITCGYPFVYHSRASNPFVNLIREATGIQKNETFWEIIDEVQLIGSTPNACMKEIGNSLQNNKDEYIHKLGTAISIWTKYYD